MAKAHANKVRPAPPVKEVVKQPADFEPVFEVPAARNGVKATGEKNRQATAIRETEVLQAVAGLNLDGVSGTIASTQAEVQKSLAGLSAKLVEQLQVLRHVEEA